MHAVFISKVYYPEGGASDIFCTVPNGTPEEIRNAILRFYSYKLQCDGEPSGHFGCPAADEYVVSVLNLETLEHAANTIQLQYGGRTIRRYGSIYANEFSEHQQVIEPCEFTKSKFVPELDEAIYTHWTPPPRDPEDD